MKNNEIWWLGIVFIVVGLTALFTLADPITPKAIATTFWGIGIGVQICIAVQHGKKRRRL